METSTAFFWMIKGKSISIFESVYLIETRFVYVFGYNGLCRLGLGDQKNRLKPEVVPQVWILMLFGKTYLKSQYSSLIQTGLFFWVKKFMQVHLAQSWLTDRTCFGFVEKCEPFIEHIARITDSQQFKNTGDGSGGQSWTTFKHVPDIMFVY